MGNKQVRIGQLIAPFGPGSIYTDRDGVPQVVAGLDHWFKRWDQTEGKMIPCSDRIEFERFEPRLSALLGVDRFACHRIFELSVKATRHRLTPFSMSPPSVFRGGIGTLGPAR